MQPITITPSNVTWLSCLKRFEALAVRRDYPKSDDRNPAMEFGSIAHDCLARYYDPKAGVPMHTQDLDTILRLSFLRTVCPDADKARDKARCRKLLLTYLNQADMTEDEGTVDVECWGNYGIKVDGEVLYHLSAKIDRVLCLPAKVVGIDYKTGVIIPSVDEVVCYMASLKAAFPRAPRYEFWVECLSEDSVTRTVFRGEDLKGAIHTITARVRRFLDATEYIPEPSDGCKWCPYRPTYRAS